LFTNNPPGNSVSLHSLFKCILQKTNTAKFTQGYYESEWRENRCGVSGSQSSGILHRPKCVRYHSICFNGVVALRHYSQHFVLNAHPVNYLEQNIIDSNQLVGTFQSDSRESPWIFVPTRILYNLPNFPLPATSSFKHKIISLFFAALQGV
jgi:hypothetical protein